MIASEFETIDKAFFNANIITKERGLVWCGDLDITKDEELLRKVSKEINEELYVLKEMDGKVNNVSEVLIEELIGKAVYVIRG